MNNLLPILQGRFKRQQILREDETKPIFEVQHIREELSNDLLTTISMDPSESWKSSSRMEKSWSSRLWLTRLLQLEYIPAFEFISPLLDNGWPTTVYELPFWECICELVDARFVNAFEDSDVDDGAGRSGIIELVKGWIRKACRQFQPCVLPDGGGIVVRRIVGHELHSSFQSTLKAEVSRLAPSIRRSLVQYDLGENMPKSGIYRPTL